MVKKIKKSKIKKRKERIGNMAQEGPKRQKDPIFLGEQSSKQNEKK